jgi:hypothetical protein
VINAFGDDLDELILITLDKNLRYIDGFYLSGNDGCVGLNEENFPYLEACPERESNLAGNCNICNIRIIKYEFNCFFIH